MAIDNNLIAKAIYEVGSVPGLTMDPDSLAEDVYLVSYAWNNEIDFEAAVASTCAALRQLVDDLVDTSQLKHDHQGWYSYHYQHRKAQRAKADMRIMFRPIDSGIEVKGFGARTVPLDFYRRMAHTRTKKA